MAAKSVGDWTINNGMAFFWSAEMKHTGDDFCSSRHSILSAPHCQTPAVLQPLFLRKLAFSSDGQYSSVLFSARSGHARDGGRRFRVVPNLWVPTCFTGSSSCRCPFVSFIILQFWLHFRFCCPLFLPRIYFLALAASIPRKTAAGIEAG